MKTNVPDHPYHSFESAAGRGVEFTLVNSLLSCYGVNEYETYNRVIKPTNLT